MPKVRAAAIGSVGDIGFAVGFTLPAQDKEARKVLQLLLHGGGTEAPDVEEANEVIDAALIAFAKVGKLEDAEMCLFPWTRNQFHYTRATAAASVMMRRTQDDAPLVVRKFLEWLVRQPPSEIPTEQSDLAVTNPNNFSAAKELKLTESEEAERNKAIVRELKRLASGTNARLRDRAQALLRDID